MRIAYFSDNFYPEISGISDSIIALGRELESQGHAVCFIAPQYAPKDYEPYIKKDKHGNTILDSREKLTILRLSSLPMPNSPTGQSRIAVPTGASISFLRKWKPDIIHTQSPYGVGLEALKAVKKLHVPLVGTNHTPIDEFVHYAPIHGKLVESWARQFDSWYYNHCQFVSAPYQGLIDTMRKDGFKKPGKGIPNPILIKHFIPATAEEKDLLKKKFKIEGPIILYSGRLAPEKKVDVIVRAVAVLVEQFPTLTLVITGHGSAEKGLRTLVGTLHLEKQVRFVGFVSTEELAWWYQVADVFSIMSVAETQSLSLMQAYASAVPAVVARAGALPDYTPEGCGFVVEEGSVRELSEKLRELLQDAPLRTRMGEKALDFVRTFSPDHIAEIWSDVYTSAIKTYRRD